MKYKKLLLATVLLSFIIWWVFPTIEFYIWALHLKQLSAKPVGVNAYLYQKKQPTTLDVLFGAIALHNWKNVSDSKKFQYVADLVFGKTLVGMPQSEVEKYLGAATSPFGGDPYYSFGNLFASQFDLCLIVRNGRVIDTYIDANF